MTASNIRRDLLSNIDSVVSVSPAVVTDGTINGAAVDLQGNGSALVAVTTGTVTDGSHVVSVDDSPDGSTDWVALTAAQLDGTPPTIVAANDDTQFLVGIVNARQWIRINIVTTGATTGALLSGSVLRGDFERLPQDDVSLPNP